MFRQALRLFLGFLAAHFAGTYVAILIVAVVLSVDSGLRAFLLSPLLAWFFLIIIAPIALPFTLLVAVPSAVATNLLAKRIRWIYPAIGSICGLTAAAIMIHWRETLTEDVGAPVIFVAAFVGGTAGGSLFKFCVRAPGQSRRLSSKG